MAYVGGGSSRAAGTMASLLAHGKEFDGSHVVLIDQRPGPADLVERIAKKLAARRGLDITVAATTDQRAGLTDVDAVLSSFRPGGFELRQADELIPMRARRHRAGDPGTRRDHHVAPLDPGDPEHHRRPGRGRPRGA